MKKLFVIVLVVVLACAMSVTAFAAAGSDTINTGTGSKDIDVSAKYIDGSSTPNVYLIDIEWGAMEFTYSSSGTRTWDPVTHTYTDSLTAGWTASGNTVKATNHSNKAVTAAFSFNKLGSITESISGAFSYDGALVLGAGAENSPATAANVTATLTLSGTLDSARTVFEKVGTITVTLS